MANISKTSDVIKRLVRELCVKCVFFSPVFAFWSLLWWLGWYRYGWMRLREYAHTKKYNFIDRYFIDNGYYPQHQEKYAEKITPENYRIWVFWLQGEENMPALVRACYQKLRQVHGNKVQFVSQSNLDSLISLPNFVYEKLKAGKMQYAHFSDLVRLSLLSRYGGLWVDATCWCPKTLPDWVFKCSIFSCHQNASDSVTYCIGTNETLSDFYTFILHSLLNYWKKENRIMDYILFDYLIMAARMKIKKVSDALKEMPINNAGRSWLFPLLNERFDQSKYDKLLSENFIFKLSYKSEYREYTPEGELTFYGKMIRGEL